MLTNAALREAGVRSICTERGSTAALVAMVLLLAAGAWLAQSTLLNHDSGWYLQATRMWLAGGKLYQDIIEINPPLAFVLHIPPVLVAQFTGISPVVLFFLWLFALIGGSTILCARIVGRLPTTPHARLGLVAAVLASLILGSWQGLGQREHFLMIFVMPYLFLAVARASDVEMPRLLAALVGGVAAFGFALKPHFIVVPLVIEAYLWLVARSSVRVLRSETISLAALLTGYWIAVAVGTPLYFSRIVPMAFLVYDSYSAPISKLLLRRETVLLPLAILLHAWIRRPGALRAVAEICLLSAICFWLVYLIQLKGFSYHRFPVRTTLLVGLAACLLAALDLPRTDGLVSRIRGASSVLAVCFVLILTTGWLVLKGGYANRFLYAGGLPVMQAHADSGARSVYVFSSNVWQAFPAANYTGMRSVSRYPAHWLLPGLVRAENAGGAGLTADERRKLGALKRFIADSVVEDFRRGNPNLVLVDVRKAKSYFASIPFDYVTYFCMDPRFAAIWEHYNRVGTIAGFDLYRRR